MSRRSAARPGSASPARSPIPIITNMRPLIAMFSSIGSGPAGLSAALAAGRAGARVILCEEDFRLGGRLLSERREIDATPAVRLGGDASKQN